VRKMSGVGIDLGTMNIVAARSVDDKISTKRIRDAFIDLPLGSERMLKLAKVSHIRRDDALLIVGDAAYDMANMLAKEVRRPLQGGLVSSGELDALSVLAILVREVLGAPAVPNEICRFSVPAAPVDAPNQDVVYHRRVLEKIVGDCGYRAMASNEALAIVFSDCADSSFSGITMSFGSGMTNVCLALHTLEAMSFSVAVGGDYIDAKSAQQLGSQMTRSRICSLKEKGIDLRSPRTREEQVLECYYRNLIEHVFEKMIEEFDRQRGKIAAPFPIPLVVSGGTSKAGGFLELFKEIFEKRKGRFPVEISEVRPAKDPLNAVAMGLLIQAMQDSEED